MFVRVVVVHDQMQLDAAGELLVQQAEKFQKFLMPMSPAAFADYFAL